MPVIAILSMPFISPAFIMCMGGVTPAWFTKTVQVAVAGDVRLSFEIARQFEIIHRDLQVEFPAVLLRPWWET